jgi:hypothetical protein
VDGRFFAAGWRGEPFFRQICAARNLPFVSAGEPDVTADSRLVVDQDFDRTVEAVLDAFLNAGFSVAPIEGGDLHQNGKPGGRLRYALLEATLPELCFVRAACRREVPPILGCRISVYEVTGSCTIVTTSNPLTSYPLLASLVPRLSERTRAALGLVALHGAGLEAA